MNAIYADFNLNGLVLALGISSLTLAGCASTPAKPDALPQVRAELTQLQTDPQLASLAPVAINDAEKALRAAEEPREEAELDQHLLIVAQSKVATARALAEAQLAEQERKNLTEQRDKARLAARTQEAELAKQRVSQLQQQLSELQAKPTDRGLVITLGDVLFDTGKSVLKASAAGHLARLSTFLQQNTSKTVLIEGHTDSQGSESYNLDLSARRADAVKAFLIRQAIDPSRLTSTGLGESLPVADNATASGRQQNRRVEVIIQDSASR